MITEAPNREERFKIINQKLIQAWRSISERCLERAWDIPGLQELGNENEEEPSEEELLEGEVFRE